MSTWARLSRRERVLVIGFAYFAELALGYMLLIDPDLSRLARVAKDEATARQAIATWQQPVPAPSVAPGASVPPVLPVKAGESFDLALARYLDAQVMAAGATPLAVQLPTPAPAASTSPYRGAHVTAAGPYPAIADLVARLGSPAYRVGLEALTMRPDPSNPKQVKAELELFVEPPPGPSRPAPSPAP